MKENFPVKECGNVLGHPSHLWLRRRITHECPGHFTHAGPTVGGVLTLHQGLERECPLPECAGSHPLAMLREIYRICIEPIPDPGIHSTDWDECRVVWIKKNIEESFPEVVPKD